MKNLKLITEIRSDKDFRKVLSNMIKSRIRKDVDKILEGGEVKFIKGGIKRTIKEMPLSLYSKLEIFYKEIYDNILIGIQKGEDINPLALEEKDSCTLKELDEYLNSRFE